MSQTYREQQVFVHFNLRTNPSICTRHPTGVECNSMDTNDTTKNLGGRPRVEDEERRLIAKTLRYLPRHLRHIERFGVERVRNLIDADITREERKERRERG